MLILNIRHLYAAIHKDSGLPDINDNFTETDINFNEFTIIAIFLEVKEHGWEIGIENVIENENNISISTIETEFDNSVITQPFYILKIPKTEKTIIVE